MTDKYKTFRPGAKKGTILTPKCRLIYPSLFEATDMKGNVGEGDKYKYRISILVPKDADTDFLQERVGEVIGDMSRKEQENAKKPFIKTADQNSLSKFADEFPLMLRCNSKYPPDVVGPDPSRKLQEDEVYSGRWGIVSINPYPYPSIDGGQPGVALGLQNVQYLDHDDVIGGTRVKAEDEFEAVDGISEGSLEEPEEGSKSKVEDMFA